MKGLNMAPKVSKRRWIRYLVIGVIAIVLFVATMHILSGVDFSALHGG
jgi:hypothetical protein